MAEIPKQGFIKLTAPRQPELSSQDRAALVRKGNQLFNSGDIETAQKVFLSVGYSDGIIRVGDYHYKQGNYMEAFRMYKIAPAPEKAAWMIDTMAEIIKEWMEE
ncbi:MAG: hypothetical protein B0D92_03790 [Spirochaeta sp. LUC14_002_19_P3]|nr:MAG: hypothetical protein B0D92_03790 [Spirochaeta sp. LUC14_002_19_P3]